MLLTFLKSKIHRATIKEANLNYVGSITIDETLLLESGIMEYEKVQVVDINNGSRFETYAIKGEKNSGIICINGAAAQLVNEGDKIIVMAYCELEANKSLDHKPRVLFVNDKNEIYDIRDSEQHGEFV